MVSCGSICLWGADIVFAWEWECAAVLRIHVWSTWIQEYAYEGTMERALECIKSKLRHRAYGAEVIALIEQAEREGRIHG